MRDRNFLVENNAKPIWHPMAHPAEMRAQPPRIVMKGEGVHVTDIDGTIEQRGGRDHHQQEAEPFQHARRQQRHK